MREITPLTQNDCFMLFSRVKKEFSFPLHCHEEFELNLILNAPGAKRRSWRIGIACRVAHSIRRPPDSS